MNDDKKNNETYVNLFQMIIRMVSRVDRLLKDEIERRELVSEEDRLSRDQLMFCEYDYNREFQMERR